jgi:hypothetical protein
MLSVRRDFAARVPYPGTPNDPVFLTVAFVKILHILAGVYM